MDTFINKYLGTDNLALYVTVLFEENIIVCTWLVFHVNSSLSVLSILVQLPYICSKHSIFNDIYV